MGWRAFLLQARRIYAEGGPAAQNRSMKEGAVRLGPRHKAVRPRPYKPAPTVALARLRKALALAAVTLAFTAAAPSDASALVSVDQFVAATQGTDGGECLGFVERYLRDVYGISIVVGSDADRSAYGLAPWYVAGKTLLADGFTWSSSDTDFQDGDVLVFDKYGLGDNGHTGIWYHGRIYDTNSEWPNRTTSSGAAVFSTTDAAIESELTTQNLLNNAGWTTPQPYLGRWRKAAPIPDTSHSVEDAAGTSAPAGN
jgi:hypothetical protein